MNVLIIGFGSIGKRHYEILSTFREVDNIDVVTQQSPDTVISTFKSLEQIELNNYDYIIIASETSKHYEQLQYIENKVKDKIILVEKPLFSKKHTIHIKNNSVFIAYNRRFYPIIIKLKELIQEEPCYYINIMTGQYLPQWRPDRDYTKTYSAHKNGGGVLLDLSHEIDYINFLCGEIEIHSAVNTKISDLDIRSDDIAIVIAKSNQNTLINFSIDYISKKFIQNIVIHLQNSTVFANLETMRLEQVYKDGTNTIYNFSEFERNYSFEMMHRNILFQKDKKACLFKEGLKIMDTIDKIKKASHGK